MDNAFELFHDRIIEAIRTGEVVCLFFPRLAKTLILDLRSTDETPPAVILDNMVATPKDRLESLQRLRPQFPLPDEVRLAPWFGFVGSLRDTGVYAALIERCDETGHAMLASDCKAAVRTLQQVEKDLLRAMVRGEMSRTLWQRK
jgi:hypothetical protein